MSEDAEFGHALRGLLYVATLSRGKSPRQFLISTITISIFIRKHDEIIQTDSKHRRRTCVIRLGTTQSTGSTRLCDF
jgi:hypothetical protein